MSSSRNNKDYIKKKLMYLFDCNECNNIFRLLKINAYGFWTNFNLNSGILHIKVIKYKTGSKEIIFLDFHKFFQSYFIFNFTQIIFQNTFTVSHCVVQQNLFFANLLILSEKLKFVCILCNLIFSSVIVTLFCEAFQK